MQVTCFLFIFFYSRNCKLHNSPLFAWHCVPNPTRTKDPLHMCGRVGIGWESWWEGTRNYNDCVGCLFQYYVVLVDSPGHKYFTPNKLCLGVIGFQVLFVVISFISKFFRMDVPLVYSLRILMRLIQLMAWLSGFHHRESWR